MKNGLSVLIIGFVVLLLGLVLIDPIADTVTDLGVLTTTTNQTVTLSNTSCASLTEGCVKSISVLTNLTSGTLITSKNYTTCKTSGKTYDNGIILTGESVGYNGYNGNTTFVQSTNCMYVPDATSRTLSGLLILFFALGIMTAGLYYLKQTGIFENLK